MTPMTERKHVRVAAPLRLLDLTLSPPEAMLTKNLSLGGAFLLTQRRPPIGSAMQLLLEQGGRKATLAARVTHFQADGIGVAFVEPEPEVLELVQAIIEELIAGGARVSERRSERRTTTDVQLVWVGAAAPHRGRLTNLSATGALIECDDSPRVGADVFLYLPGYTYSSMAGERGQPSEARGCAARIVHRNARGFGVEFVEASAEFRMAVETALRSPSAGPARNGSGRGR